LRVLFALLAAALVVGATLFVLSLPPSLSIKEGSTFGVVRANFPTTTSTEHPVVGNFTATTYANQSSGPSSSLTIQVSSHGFAVGYNYALSYVEFFYDIAVIGKFASNLRPGDLQFITNVSGSRIALDFFNNWDQGPNVSSDRQQTFGFWNNGTGILSASLKDAGRPGAFYEFKYGAHGQSELWNYKATQFIGFRAIVTGWMMPPINVAIVMEITNVPKTITLFPKGTSFTVYGYNATQFEMETLAPLALTGAFNASSPVTAYFLNLTEWWAWGDGRWTQPTAFHWRSAVGIQAGSIDAILPPGEIWFLAFVKTPLPSPGPVHPVTVAATQDILVTT